MVYKSILVGFISFFWLFALGANENDKCYKKESLFSSHDEITKKYLLKKLIIENVGIDVYTPQKESSCYKLLLVLPGWNFSKDRWFKETRLLEYLDNGYVMIAPDMKTTIYESQYFPETKMKWHRLTGIDFVKILLNYFQKNQLLKEGHYNFILGLSTGGRGAILIPMYIHNVFLGVAALSGDFDQTLAPNDNLMKLVYGDYKIFKKRWEEIDNPIFYIKNNKDKWNTHIYLGHGTNDKIVISQHTEHFYKFLKEQNLNVKIEINLRNFFGHDFKYWDFELPYVFSFFESLTKK